MTRELISIIVIAVLFLPLILQQANAEIGPYSRTLILKITNMKTGDVKTRVWNFDAWTFTKPLIDVPEYTVKKIFYTDTFSFSLSSETYDGKWLHFKVELTETPILIGRGFTAKFV